MKRGKKMKQSMQKMGITKFVPTRGIMFWIRHGRWTGH